MTRKALYTRLLLFLAIALAGCLTQRSIRPSSSSGDGVRHLAARAERLPDRVGRWQMVGSQKLSTPVQTMLACEAFVSRAYRHLETGEVCNVAVIVGPPGPTAAHEPAACYAARFERLALQQIDLGRLTQEDRRGHLWLQALQADDTRQHYVLYGWSDGGQWSAPRHARLALARHRLLAKVQISASAPHEAAARQACGAFLRDLLPALDRHVVEPLRKVNRCS